MCKYVEHMIGARWINCIPSKPINHVDRKWIGKINGNPFIDSINRQAKYGGKVDSNPWFC